jgi:GNAT superfamily N-acetyltransferase
VTHSPAGSNDDSPFDIVLFDADRHDATEFTCGNDSLDTYLHVTMPRDLSQRSAVAYVLIDPLHASQIVGYFTLSSFSFSRRQARRRDRDRFLGQYDPVPAVLIGRLAVALAQQGKGIGSVLLYSALIQVLRIRERVGVTAVTVHGIDDAAATFYEHFGFARFRDESRHLYYPLATFEATLATVIDKPADAQDE